MMRMKTPKDLDMGQVLSFEAYQSKKESFAASDQESNQMSNEGDDVVEKAASTP